jgi:putative phosphonate metabolism protein
MNQARYAVYYVPKPDTPLAQFGTRWLGRDVATGEAVVQPTIADLDATRLVEITNAPRKYGFHATLKPPFKLAEGCDLRMLDEALEAFVAAQEPFEAPALELAELDGFIALRPKKTSDALHQFAEECVRAFDPFRAPPSQQELEKRLSAELTDKQIKLLKKWGYPYVMSEFCFHMTLTERLKGKERKRLVAELELLVKDALSGKKWMFDSIALVCQKTPDEPFEVKKFYTFAPHRKRRWLVKK